MHAYNCTVHDTTGISPYYIIFSLEPRLPVDVTFGTNVDAQASHSYTDFMKKVKDRLDHAFDFVNRNSNYSQGKPS